MKIALGFDHGGFEYKAALTEFLTKNGYEYVDFGTYSNASVDYPDYAIKVAKAVVNKECDKGILICGTGIGMSISANKVKGIRCGLANDYFSAKATRQHNDTNVLAMGARVIGIGTMLEIVNVWLTTDYIGSYHQKRLDKIAQIENDELK
ncbi:MAG: ribose 5-phosphate isomerase B [Clostridia bacterium]